MRSPFTIKLRTGTSASWQILVPGEKGLSLSESAYPIYLYVEGPGTDQLSSHDLESCNPGIFVAEGGSVREFLWEPFPLEDRQGRHYGKIAYGLFTLRIPGQPEEYFINIVPSRLSVEQWKVLFDDLCRIADALLTGSTEESFPHLKVDDPLQGKHFSPAIALAELNSDDWPALERSLRRISRRPRTEFRPPRPGTPQPDLDEFPEPISSTEVYENHLVTKTTQRLGALLREIARRAECSREAEELKLEHVRHAYYAADAMALVEQRITNLHNQSVAAYSRAAALERMTRNLPRLRSAASLTPHLTPRIRLHPDYNQVMRWWRTFGRQRVALLGQALISTLPARRASTLYEYWVLFSLCTAIGQLGYSPKYSALAHLVREDFFELEIWRNVPIEFISADRQEVLSLWYERPAQVFFDETSKKISKKNWMKYWDEKRNKLPGLYARSSPMEPDFWFEFQGHQGAAVAVGDAIFSEGVDGEGTNRKSSLDVAGKKADRVANYVNELILVRGSDKRPLFPVKSGLVIYCGTEDDVELIENSCAQQDIDFLPLRPNVNFSISNIVLERLGQFFAKMRESAVP